MKLKESAAFLAISLLLCWFVAGDAMVGKTLMAPVDLAPANWAQYRFVDPETNGISKNVHQADQLAYDLPNQWTIYHAFRRGEMPWWNPYTMAGRPLLADAHVSATDPVRVVCFLLIPDFVLAYNWVFIAHFLIGGLSLFCLLRFFGVSRLIAGGIGLAGMLPGYLDPLIGYPWVHGSFVYYPWLWIAWHKLREKRAAGPAVAAGLLAAVILYTGNLQSHSYLVLFAGAFVAGYGGMSLRGWLSGMAIVVPTGVVAGLLASPVILPELELFLLSDRSAAVHSYPIHVWDGLVHLAAVWPWPLGTSQTFSNRVYNFYAFIGCAAALLACIGMRAPRALPSAQPGLLAAARRCAVIQVLIYLVVMTIPALNKIFYFRLIGMMVLGVVVLAGFGASTVAAREYSNRRLAKWVVGFSLLVALGTSLMIFVVYPKIKPRMISIMEARQEAAPQIGSKAMRQDQVEQYPRVISFTNPEVLASWLGLLSLAVLLAVPRWRRASLPLTLALNLCGPVLHARRALPAVPLAMWERMLAGSPEQQNIRSRLNPQFLRLYDEVEGMQTRSYLAELSNLHEVRVVHGYAALMPRTYERSTRTDWTHFADFRLHHRQLEAGTTTPPARFQWLGESPRSVRIVGETLNTIDVEVGDGPAGDLRQTDTPYPGWKAEINGMRIKAFPRVENIDTILELPAGPARVHLSYTPTGLFKGLVFAAFGVLGLVAWALFNQFQPLRKRQPLPPSPFDY